jgi:hypothetical protein
MKSRGRGRQAGRQRSVASMKNQDNVIEVIVPLACDQVPPRQFRRPRRGRVQP